MTESRYHAMAEGKEPEGEVELLEHTADTGIVARGRDLGQAFAKAAEGMFNLMVDLETVGEELTREVEVEAKDETSLLVEWLSELLYIWDTDNLIGKKFDITELTPHHLKATVYGQKFDRDKHVAKIAIKAVTYHQLQVEKQDGYRVQVIFDI